MKRKQRVEVVFLRGAPGRCVVEQGDTGGKLTAVFNLVCDGKERNDAEGYHYGWIKLSKQKFRGRSVWNVADLYVDMELRRSGYATALYTAAAEFACKKRGRLASLDRIDGAHSHDFWAKQERKGRAVRIPGAGHHVDRQRNANIDAFVLDVCGPRIDLSGSRRRISK